ncbi:Uncharacterized protein FWK35_00026130 [Aphis craccivora]|uniref:Uncharacterized protein n=1 Tax=Aphis craccivora TaxID=307492 RepID=A0A6G0X2S9_APHCR|nr:Uncharacterized protein FWK35_00026130 [Aphis craccivora]
MYIVKPVLENNLTYIKSNFIKMTMAIDSLQQQNVPLSKSIKIVEDIKKSFETLNDQNGKAVNKKLHQVLEKKIVVFRH